MINSCWNSLRAQGWRRDRYGWSEGLVWACNEGTQIVSIRNENSSAGEVGAGSGAPGFED